MIRFIQRYLTVVSNGSAAKERKKMEDEKRKALLMERERLRATLAESKNNVRKVEMEIGQIKNDIRKEGI